MKDSTLNSLRQRIDAIDEQLYQLIKQRGEVAKAVAMAKQNTPQAQYYRPEREAQLLRKIIKRNDSHLSDEALAQIFRDIMTACLAVQKPMTIAYLGPAGTFSHMACLKHFGQASSLHPEKDIPSIFRQVEASNMDFGVVPIENSTEGMVNLSLDSLLHSSLKICGEIEIPIVQHLMRRKGAQCKIQHIYGHEQSFAQCRSWLSQHYPDVEIHPVSSNAVAVQHLDKDNANAILGAKLAAELYDLEVVHSNIEDERSNTTRFYIMGKQDTPPSGDDKTSLLISSPHSPGALHDILRPLSKHGVNMTSIASRPYKHRNWHYIFFIDIEGHQQQSSIKDALSELTQTSIMLNILGSYPKAMTYS